MSYFNGRYGFTLGKLVCLGYVSQPSYFRERNISKRKSLIVNNNFIMDSSTLYEIDVAGKRFKAQPHIFALTSHSSFVA